MQTVETRLRSEMDAIFDFLGASRSSVQQIVPPSTDKECEKAKAGERVDKNGNLPSFQKKEEDSITNKDVDNDDDSSANSSPPRPQTLDMSDSPSRTETREVTRSLTEVDATDPRKKLLKSQQLIERHINKLLKELEEKNEQSSRLHSS